MLETEIKIIHGSSVIIDQISAKILMEGAPTKILNRNFQNQNWNRNTVKLIEENVPLETKDMQKSQHNEGQVNEQQGLNFQGSWD